MLGGGAGGEREQVHPFIMRAWYLQCSCFLYMIAMQTTTLVLAELVALCILQRAPRDLVVKSAQWSDVDSDF